jgi:hypothetical protein
MPGTPVNKLYCGRAGGVNLDEFFVDAGFVIVGHARSLIAYRKAPHGAEILDLGETSPPLGKNLTALDSRLLILAK